MKPRYPIYIVSKWRWNNCITHRALNEMSLPHYIVVEESQLELYKEKMPNGNYLVLPKYYLDDYDTCDLILDKGKGPGSARNFCIDHSTNMGYKRHWVLDDNIDAFHYLNRNEKYEVKCGSTFAAAEDFVDRYSNVPVAGFNYYSFCKKTDKVPPYVKNTRIYSCILYENNSGYRWRGRYNEDTDLSLRVLKDGKCTIQFNAFLCGKVTTQRMKGGNTEAFYAAEGTLPKSQMLVDLHPDVSRLAYKFNRWHHHVAYKVFKNNLLVKATDKVYSGVNNYGLKLVDCKK
jgi:hypothetical protein